MNETEKNLEECLEAEKGGREEKLLCDYCGEELNPRGCYQYSEQGGKYCDKKCFDMSTED